MELFQELFGFAPSSLEVNGLGNVVAHGSLIEELKGSDDGLGRTGVAATIRRVGFLPHDGFIFQTLTERGGVLVVVESESRAADALALFHSYGGGNAAIGAWSGRVPGVALEPDLLGASGFACRFICRRQAVTASCAHFASAGSCQRLPRYALERLRVVG